MTAPAVNIYMPVKNAINTLVAHFVLVGKARNEQIKEAHASELTAQLNQVLTNQDSFLQKITDLDELVARYSEFTPLKEYLFDLFLTHFLAAAVHTMGEEYLESSEWQQVEEKTLDRGTELFNLLLYINEAVDDDVEISLDDFLKEFLLTEEDEFQDEHSIYEDLISNQELLDAEPAEIIQVWKKEVSNRSALEHLFIPSLLFFSDPEALQADAETLLLLQNEKEIPAEQPALLQALYAFKNGFHDQINIHPN